MKTILTESDLKNIKYELTEANQMLSKYDKLKSEIYHDIETRNFNAFEGYKLAKELQEVLQIRRAWKVKIRTLRQEFDKAGGDKRLNKINKSKQKKVKQVINKKGWYAHFNDEAMAILNGGMRHA